MVKVKLQDWSCVRIMNRFKVTMRRDEDNVKADLERGVGECVSE